MRSWLLPTDPEPLVADISGVGPPVVLLHGQPGEAGDWDLVVAALKDRARMIVPDRPGYGRTGGSAAGVAANADAVVALLDRAGVERAVVVGYSWAGAVALDLAQRHRARVTGLVLVASVGTDGSIDELDRALTAPVIGPALALGGIGMMQVPVVRRLLAADAADRLPRASLSVWRSFVLEQRALVAELPGVTARLEDTHGPAIVIVSDADRVVRPSAQHALADALPDAHVIRIAEAGHLLPWESPGVIADAVVRMTEHGSA